MRTSRVLALVAAACLPLAACTHATPEPTPSTSATPTPTTPTTATTAVPAVFTGLPATSLVSFADFAGVALPDPDTPAYPGPATPATLDGVVVADGLHDSVTALGAALAANGVVVEPLGYPQLQFVYEANWYENIPTYVTTDVAYHEWHLAFDKVLRDLEQARLLPTLTSLVSGLLDAAAAQRAELAGTPLADDAARVEQLYQVAAVELGLDVTPGPLARQEVALIGKAAAGAQTSPLLGSPVDYSLFTPRGHYTRNADLTRYFLAMTTLGQLAFCLPGTTACADGIDATRLGLLASRLLVADQELTTLWRQIYEPTAFLVGLADDYTPAELADAATGVDPGWLDDPSGLADDATIQAAVTALTSTRPVQINPASAAVRVMGTRFVLDAYVLDQLIYPNVGTAIDPRGLPSGLDTAAVLGSSLARQVLDASGAPAYAHYTQQRDALSAAVANRPTAQWGATVYDAWLYALQPVLAAHGTAYPDYMRSDVWAAKALQTGMASYTELKHDTILYAKQAMAEAGGDEPRTLTNWVEPDPAAFDRVAAAADLMRRGLDRRGLLTDDARTVLTTLGDHLTFLAGVARTELAGGTVSAADNERLRDTGSQIEQLVWLTSDLAADAMPESDQDAALVADVATDQDRYLELATARFDRLLVLVPTDGGFEVAAGAVNSYREFESTQRFSDETWRVGDRLGVRPCSSGLARRVVRRVTRACQVHPLSAPPGLTHASRRVDNSRADTCRQRRAKAAADSGRARLSRADR